MYSTQWDICFLKFSTLYLSLYVRHKPDNRLLHELIITKIVYWFFTIKLNWNLISRLSIFFMLNKNVDERFIKSINNFQNHALNTQSKDYIRTTGLPEEICLFWNWSAFSLACTESEKARQFQNKQIFSGNPIILILS